MRKRTSTATSNFGVGRRESHDASRFYARFTAPEVSADAETKEPPNLIGAEACILGDSRSMTALPDRCVALVVTSPPYFAGKAYEEALGEGSIPGSYLEYLEMLRDVFAECKRVLEPGGRIAVNVANLGRKPYRSLSADVISILQDDLGLLLRGEIVWVKAEGAGGSCAWGSFKSAANPVLRDLSERVIVASKGRFDRAVRPAERARRGLPHVTATTNDEFLEATVDVWRIPAESARRVSHPAPFPVELPERLIRLYTYEDDLVLDPFLGSGSALVAAVRAGRRYVGYDTDEEYVTIARDRVTRALAAASANPGPFDRAVAEGKPTSGIARAMLEDAGFVVEAEAVKIGPPGTTVDFVARDAMGRSWHVLVAGGMTVTRSGLARTEQAWAAVGRASVLSASGDAPVLLLTSHRPRPKTEPDTALRAAGRTVVFDVIELMSDDGRARLATYAAGGNRDRPVAGFWPA